MSGNFLSCIKGVEYLIDFQERTWDFSRDAAVGKGLISRCGENPMVFLDPFILLATSVSFLPLLFSSLLL